MAEFATIARPYAKALFGLAQEKNQIESWLGGLKELASVVQQEKVASLIDQPEKSAVDKVDALAELVGLSDVNLKNFVTVLAEQKRLQVLPEIYAQYQDLTLALNHTKRAVITSAYALTDTQLAELTADLQKRFGTELVVSTQTDPELIGGVKVEIGDQVLDLSLQGKLNALYAAMTN
ncbi:F0F1 ATP synthase subunit delta [Neisseria weaveri]|uniref:ATP synthase subunit delta n=1 Tax=Neisseria weaveri TaxID=28091 RepID=A0A3S4Z475_9NEIS|nr:F0F1 ATP synthase subunit delta [Neisseria weaveri]EGV36843.1 ATP synthase F1, delta subunit [Neisseria weaveri LMG 5135]EGV37326.1 ATP synthase F1, delta subunit [Neisseria weaveri ATCC 51223]SAY51754.1 ATP synthase F0F1 subunit delta [Neisseria weaveri]VEJ51138.1 ATP synthase F0F1 subunit delta [Neisseria weaveri]